MNSQSSRKVYFDHMANTPVDPRVAEAMLPHLKETCGNPLNLHDFGAKTAAVIEEARQQVAGLIGADPKEIIFTSCGSESNNFALKGIAKANEKKGKHIITSAIEHFSIHYPLKELEKEGFKVTYLPVDKYGLIDPQAVAAAITPETILVALTHASNEIGTIEPIAEIGKVVKEKGVLFHVDAVQTAGTIPLNVSELKVDALTLSANQFYGPTGVAALYLKKGTRVLPQESIGECFVTGHPARRLPGHASVHVKYVEGESMSMFLNMEGIAVSTGSACVSKALKASHVLLAIGVNPEDVHGSLVMSMGKDNTEEDVDYVLEKLPPIVKRLREMSPLHK